MESCQNIWV